MADCLFCKIIDGEIPGDIVYENDNVLAFKDINPVAPTHILIIPKTEIPTFNDIEEEHQMLLGGLLLAAKKIAADQNLSKNGYRLVINCNDDGGQTVYHLHMHIIGGRKLSWPPG